MVAAAGKQKAFLPNLLLFFFKEVRKSGQGRRRVRSMNSCSGGGLVRGSRAPWRLWLESKNETGHMLGSSPETAAGLGLQRGRRGLVDSR